MADFYVHRILNRESKTQAKNLRLPCNQCTGNFAIFQYLLHFESDSYAEKPAAQETKTTTTTNSNLTSESAEIA